MPKLFSRIWKSPERRNLLYISLGLAVFVCLTFVVFFRIQSNYRQAVISQWQQQLQTTTSIAAINLENFIDKYSENLIVVAKDPVIKAKSCNRLSPYFEKGYCPLFNLYSVHGQDINAIMLLDKNGNIKIRFPAFNEPGQPRHMHCARGVESEKKLIENQAYVSDVFWNNFNVPAITISVPVFNDSSFSGVVRWMLTTSKISAKYIDPIVIGKKGYIWMADGSFNIISQHNKKLVGKNIFGIFNEMISNYLAGVKPVKSKKNITESIGFLNKLKTEEEGFGSYLDFSNNEYSLAVFRKVEVGNNKWVLVSSIPYREITGPFFRNAMKNYFLSGFISVVIILVTILFYNIKKKKAGLEIEAKYLSEIASSAEELHQERQKRLTAVIDGQELERSRISRELHDGLGQDLLAIKMKMEEISENTSDKVLFSGLKKSFLKTIDEAKRISNDLKPVMLDELGIVTAIKNMCSELSVATKIKIDVVSYGVPDALDPKIQTYIYRICQEGLSNIVRHSEATEADIQLLGNEKQLSLVIQDNGHGFDTSQKPPGRGNGLYNIRDRVLIVDGSFEISSLAGEGTVLTIKIPLN